MRLTVKHTAIAAAIAFAFCNIQSARASDGFWERSYEPEQKHIKKVKSAVDRFNDFDKLAQDNVASIGDYVRSGIVLSDLACEEWLGSLGRADRDVSFAKDIMNIVGNLIIGISGINGANPSSLARGSLGLAAGNASVDAFKNEVILGALADIEAKLVEGRKITAATIKGYIPTTTNYDDAKGLLISYHRDCSPNAVKILLKTSLAAVKYEPADTSLSGPIVKAKTMALVAKLVDEIYPGNASKELSTDDLYKLYVMKIAAPEPNPKSFVAAMITPESTALANDFSSKNVDARLGMLQTIADLKQFEQRYKADKTAAESKDIATEQKAKLEKNAASQALADAQKALSTKEAAKVAATPEVAEFLAAPLSKPLTPSVLSELKKASLSITGANASSAAKAFAAAVNALEVKTATLSEVQKVKSANDAAPAPKPTVSDPSKSGVAPASVNAVLVPVAGGK